MPEFISALNYIELLLMVCKKMNTTAVKTNLLSLAVALFCIVFVCETVTMQIVYSSMDILKTPLSFYATGDLWYVVSSGLVLIGASYLIMAYLFMNSGINCGPGIKAGCVTLTIVGVCTFLLTIFQTDTGSIVTVKGQIHIISAHFHFILLPLAIILISSELKEAFWKAYRLYSLTFSSILIAIGLTLLLDDTLGIAGFSGIIQKTLILNIVVWISISAQVLLQFQKVRLKRIQ